jgi:hypothetical protein
MAIISGLGIKHCLRDSEITELGALWDQIGIKDQKVRYPQ